MGSALPTVYALRGKRKGKRKNTENKEKGIVVRVIQKMPKNSNS
jgi:hypothetical protein